MRQRSRTESTPVIFQTEAAECGLACLAMVAGHHGLDIDLTTLRRDFSTSSRGVTLADLMKTAEMLHLTPRPVKAEVSQLNMLKLPAVLHWNFTHFVVVTKVTRRGITIHDPETGTEKLGLEAVSRAFTGVALELTPSVRFEPRVERQRVGLRQLVGSNAGLSRLIFEALSLAAVLEVLALVSPLLIQLVLDRAIVAQDKELVAGLAIGFLLLALFQAGTMTIRGFALIELSARLNLQMANNLFKHLLALKLEYFQKRTVGDTISRFESVRAIQDTVTNGSIAIILDGIMAALTFIVIIAYSAQLTIIVVCACLAYTCLRLYLFNPYRHLSDRHIIQSAKQQTHFVETIRGVQSLKLFNREASRRMHWQRLTVDAFNSEMRLNRMSVSYQGLNAALFAAENVLVVTVGAGQVINGGLTVGQLVAFIAYKTLFINRTSGLVEKAMEFRLLGLHRERIADIALAEVESSPSGAAPRIIEGQDPVLELRDVSFRYASTEPYILEGINLAVARGESVAIVGPSGCGKTTLLKIILGLLSPTSGEILVDGVPMSRLGSRAFRERVGTVMQNDSLFAGTIAENVAFFEDDASLDRIKDSLSVACIADEVAAMPMAYNTAIGDMGDALSGGQKQRILLARALYRSPSILILDEATSHLDVDLERRISAAVRALSLTRIFVAHRPETVKSATRVFELAPRASDGA